MLAQECSCRGPFLRSPIIKTNSSDWWSNPTTPNSKCPLNPLLPSSLLISQARHDSGGCVLCVEKQEPGTEEQEHIRDRVAELSQHRPPLFALRWMRAALGTPPRTAVGPGNTGGR